MYQSFDKDLDRQMDSEFHYLCQTCHREPNLCKCADYGEEWLKDHYPLAKRRGRADNYKPIFTTLECELIWDTDWYFISRFPKLFRVWENGKLISNYGYTHPEFEILGEWFLFKHYLSDNIFGFTHNPYAEKPKDCPEHFLFKIDWTLMYVPGYELSKGDCVLKYNQPTEKQLAREKDNWNYMFDKEKPTIQVPRSALDMSLDELRARGVTYYPHLSYPHYRNPKTDPYWKAYRESMRGGE